MNCVSKGVPVAFALAAIHAACTLGAVNVTSRLSTATASHGGSIAPPEIWNDSGTYTALGNGTINLPHGYTHTSTVTNSLISGQFFGSYSESGISHSVDRSSVTLEVLFTVGVGGMKASIFLNGSAHNVNLGGASLTQNAYFVLQNADTSTVVFDAFPLGTVTVDALADLSTIKWTNFSQQLTLSAGNYKLLVGADGDYTSHPGPGSGNSGSANLTASMTFTEVPAPAPLALATGALAFAGRRRR